MEKLSLKEKEWEAEKLGKMRNRDLLGCNVSP